MKNHFIFSVLSFLLGLTPSLKPALAAEQKRPKPAQKQTTVVQVKPAVDLSYRGEVVASAVPNLSFDLVRLIEGYDVMSLKIRQRGKAIEVTNDFVDGKFIPLHDFISFVLSPKAPKALELENVLKLLVAFFQNEVEKFKASIDYENLRDQDQCLMMAVLNMLVAMQSDLQSADVAFRSLKAGDERSEAVLQVIHSYESKHRTDNPYSPTRITRMIEAVTQQQSLRVFDTGPRFGKGLQQLLASFEDSEWQAYLEKAGKKGRNSDEAVYCAWKGYWILKLLQLWTLPTFDRSQIQHVIKSNFDQLFQFEIEQAPAILNALRTNPSLSDDLNTKAFLPLLEFAITPPQCGCSCVIL